MNYTYTKVVLALAASIITPACLGFYCKEPTRLMKALESKQSPQEIKRLIEQGEDVNAVDSECIRLLKPVLRYALDRGADKDSVTIINMLIKAGADVTANTYNRVTDERVFGIMPLLTYASIYSSAEIVQMFIDAGARDSIPVVQESSVEFTKSALMIAQELGRTDVVNVLTGIPYMTF